MANTVTESVAVDLGSSLVKIIVTDKKGAIVKTVVATNTLNYSLPLKPNQIDGVSTLLKQIFDENKLPKKNVLIAMPERYVATQVIEIPTLTDAELASSVPWQAQQYIPIPKEDLNLNYQVLYRPDKKDVGVQNMRVLLAGISQTNLNNLVSAYTHAGLETSVVETESIATLRHLPADDNSDGSSLVINFGGSGMDLTVVRGNELTMVVSHQTGSNMITKALINTFNLPVDKAEEYKRAYGFDARHAEGKIANAIVPAAQIILNNIKNAISFYNAKNSLQIISKVYLCGGGVLTPGFPELLATNLGIEVTPLDVFANLTGALPEKDHLLFPVAAGLTKRK
jgi:type IV pilus assembly protein PilM